MMGFRGTALLPAQDSIDSGLRDAETLRQLNLAELRLCFDLGEQLGRGLDGHDRSVSYSRE